MSLDVGARLGSYEIGSALGAGGMGEVYRARDTKLGRSVAIKVLPEAFLSDPERVHRFEREAKVLASLNHPNIAALYGMEESGDRRFLIMELVEGETLAERLAHHPKPSAFSHAPSALGSQPRAGLPASEALTIACQIAEALETAHEQGVVHRDLKPANVKITPDGKVKVLDFGLAKAMETSRDAGSIDPVYTNSPTFSMVATQAGVILGTAAYMSPEQAKGLQADHRSDIFSFGVVLYEMLAGRQPFQGETAPDVIASVMVRDADLGSLPPGLNPRLPDLVRRCLEKHPKKRWQAIGDVRAELEAIAAAPHARPVPAAAVVERRPAWRRAVPIAITAVVAGALGGAAVWTFRSSAAPTIVRFAFELPEGQNFTNTGRQLVAISPDGTKIVYVANQRLHLRSASDLEARPIPGTDIAQSFVTNPVFSPDGLSVAFYSSSDNTLKRIALSGGAAVTICPADNPFGMSWNEDGIVFGQGGKGIMRVPATGGTPETIVSVEGDEEADGPQMLPGGQSVLFTLAKGATGVGWDKASVVVQTLGSDARKTLIDGGSDARYLPTGHLVYALSGVLFAIPFDPRALEVRGGPVSIVEGVRRANAGQTGVAHFSFSSAGTLTYIPGAATTSSGQVDLALVDRQGAVQPLKLPAAAYEVPRVSPDGKRVAFVTDDGKEAAVWVYELAGTSSMRRLTFGGRNRFPIWSADGARIAFQSDREGDAGIFWQRADGTGSAERLTKADPETSHTPEAWSPTGDPFLYSVAKGNNFGLWMFSLQDRKAAPFDAVESTIPSWAVFSPDGQWVAYAAQEQGQSVATVYVQPFPPTGTKYQISKNTNARHPFWSPDGKEIFHVPAGGQFVSVSVATAPTFTFGNPVQVPGGGLLTSLPLAPRNHDILPDGRRIGLINAADSPTGSTSAPEIRVVLNWFEEVKQRAPVP